MYKGVMSPDEKEFHSELMRALDNSNSSEYADILDDFPVCLTDDKSITSGTACITTEAGNYVIYFDTDFLEEVKQESKEKNFSYTGFLAMVIKHELLHKILNHLDRSVAEVAKSLGIDFTSITEISAEDKARIHKVLMKVNNMLTGNAPYSYNTAGDADLARLYSQQDIEIASKIGGIIRDDFPEYEGYSMEQIMDALDYEDDRLKLRLAKIVDIDYNDEDGSYTELQSNANWYTRNKRFHKEDVKSITIPDIKTLDSLPKDLTLRYSFWLRDTNTNNSDKSQEYKALYWDHRKRGISSQFMNRPLTEDSKDYIYTAICIRLKNIQWINKLTGEESGLFGLDRFWNKVKGSRDLYFTLDSPVAFNKDMEEINEYKGSSLDNYVSGILKNFKERD